MAKPAPLKADDAATVVAALAELIEGFQVTVVDLEERLSAVEATVQRLAERAPLDEVLDCLNREQIRATYGAVGEVLGVPAQAVGRLLSARDRCPRNSWIVSAGRQRPTGYEPGQMHAALLRTRRVIKTGEELQRLLDGKPVE